MLLLGALFFLVVAIAILHYKVRLPHENKRHPKGNYEEATPTES